MMPGPFLLPVKNARISCSYTCHTSRRPPSSNPGTDWAVPIGTPVFAPMDAAVTRVSHVANQPQGRHVWLRDPRDGAELQMMHFSAPQVSAGQRVAAGQQVGLSGNTGNSTGPHLHVSLWYQGRTHDFMNYVGGSSSGGGSNPYNPNQEDEMTLYVSASGGNDLVAAGNVYANDGVAGTWRGLTNLEVFFVKGSGAPILTIAANDLSLLFAVRGVSEQRAVPSLPTGVGNFMGLGQLTGRVMFPGSVEPVNAADPNGPKLGSWHYPHTQ